MKKAKDIMSQNLISVREDDRLAEVVDLLAKHALSGAPVANKQNEVIGYISEKDIIMSVFPESLRTENPDSVSAKQLALHVKRLSQSGAPLVKDYMNETVYAVDEDTCYDELLELMLGKNLKRLPVLRDRRLVGMIERSDIVELMRREGKVK